MAKAKKSVAMRKKSSKRGTASAKPARRKAAKRTAPKKAKPKVPRASKSTKKPAAKMKQLPKTPARKTPREAPQMVEGPVETTIIDVIEEPIPGLVVVTEYESVRRTPSVSPNSLPKRDAGPGTEEQ